MLNVPDQRTRISLSYHESFVDHKFQLYFAKCMRESVDKVDATTTYIIPNSTT